MNQDVSVNSSEGGFADSAKGAVAKTAARDLYITPIPRSHIIYPPPDG